MNPFARLFDRLKPAPPPDEATQAGLRRIVELVDKNLAAVSGFERKLALPVANARAWCARLAAELPPPIAIDRAAFAADPLVHALFGSVDDIARMVAASAPVRAFLADAVDAGDDFVALMAARRQEKQTLGVAVQGELVATDVPQTLLQFSNQTLVLPAADIEAERAAMIDAGFDGLLQTFAAHVEQAREIYKSLKAEREMRFSPAVQAKAPFPPRQIPTLDARLRQGFEALLPDALVDELARFLNAPQEALSLAAVELWVTRTGVLQNAAAHDAEADPIRFMELSSRDRRRHVVLPVRIRRADARAALEQARAARDEWMLI
ncbi:MAG: hypothetical protein LBR05_08975 [Azoarcus sp.]|jgi:hypothetical protein|nr:hypothetical protein [Azoarcus sp.]